MLTSAAFHKLGSVAVAGLLAFVGPPAGHTTKVHGATEDDGKLTWIANYDEALAEAKRTGRPLFLEFRCVP